VIAYDAYRLIHLIGIFSAVAALSLAAVAYRLEAAAAYRKGVAMVHGGGLLLALIGGFGMLGRMGYGFPIPGWAVLKIVLWVAVGGVLVVAKRRLIPVGSFVALVVALAAIGAAIALYKPFA